jgi:hypothetical protein
MRSQRVAHAAVLALACVILPGTLGHRLVRIAACVPAVHFRACPGLCAARVPRAGWRKGRRLREKESVSECASTVDTVPPLPPSLRSRVCRHATTPSAAGAPTRPSSAWISSRARWQNRRGKSRHCASSCSATRPLNPRLAAPTTTSVTARSAGGVAAR